MYLQPLKMDKCRELFYLHYKFNEQNNAILNDIIDLTARLTIMIVFIGKVAFLEGLSLWELYRQLVEKGFKLSEEDVSCEHEKLKSDETIIQQMCILFSLVKYSEADKAVLTYASVIPNLKFSFSDAKKWFKIKKNSHLMKLFSMGMLEHHIKERTHIYWMHSVIAAAVREQQKNVIYKTTEPFIHELSEEMEFGDVWGKGYTKIDLIPFSWSIADIFETHWNTEDDSVFLLRLYYICFEASNYPLCKILIDKVVEIDATLDNPEMLIRDYKNYSELLLRLDDVDKAIEMLDIAKGYMEKIDYEHRQQREWAYLWHQYGNIYFHAGEADNALDYYTEALEIDLKIPNLPKSEISTDYSSIANVYQMFGDLLAAYEMIKKAIEIDPKDEDNSETFMQYYYLASICTDLVSNGYDDYKDEAQEYYEKVIGFREKYLPKYSNDLADVYLEYSNFRYQCYDNENAKLYCKKAYDIYCRLYGEDSYHILQCLSTEALILADEGKSDEAIELYEKIIEKDKMIANIHINDLCNDYQNYADLLERAGRYEDAIEYYEKCIACVKKHFSDDSPNMVQSYIGLGNCYLGKNDYDSALRCFEEISIFCDEDILLERMMNYKLGTCYALLKDYKKAIEHYKTTLDLCDKNGETDPGYIYVDMSKIYNLCGDKKQSIYYGNLAKEYADRFSDDELIDYVHTLETNIDKK